jgi:voltage-gated potassium channel
MLRPLRIVRTAGLLRAVGVARAETSIVRILRRGRRAFGRHRIVYSSLFIALVTLGITIVAHQAERYASGANLTSFGGTLWWAVQVVTTVGPADSYPVTMTRRISAVVLMVTGVGLFGLVAASLASTYIFRGDEEGSRSHAPQSTDLRALADRLERIEAELQALRCAMGGPSPPPSAGPEGWRNLVRGLS